MSKSKSEKGLQREFQKLSNKMLTFFILICLFLIILTYISFAQFYTQTKDLNSKYSAKVMLNDIQYKPSIQPIIQIKVFGGYNDYYFKIVDTGKTYYSSEPGREFIKSLLLPKDYFSKNITVEYGIVNISQSEFKVKVIDGPVPEFTVN